ncbi:MAG: methyl-accepting chemotaxis protein [Gammaproteobacteria bacterium]|nr:methyl-accepting chemotaxis protein [Gammaproteobacteria bacterium]
MKRQVMGKGELDKLKGLTAITNLLAFNTMIEAARIGQEGRGFANVAEELTGITRKADRACTRAGLISKRRIGVDPEAIDTAIQDQLLAMEDLNASMSSITQLTAEITRSPGRKTLPRKELNHLYDLLGRNSGKDIA